MMGMTSLLRFQHNPFGDPAFPMLMLQQFFINRVLDSFIRWMTRQVLWKPRDNAPTKDFTRQVTMALKHKESQIYLYEWRARFFEKHKSWFLQTLPHIFRKAGLPRDDTKPTREDLDSDDVSEAAQKL